MLQECLAPVAGDSVLRWCICLGEEKGCLTLHTIRVQSLAQRQRGPGPGFGAAPSSQAWWTENHRILLLSWPLQDVFLLEVLLCQT